MFRTASRFGECRVPEDMEQGCSYAPDRSNPITEAGDMKVDNSNHVLEKIARLYAERLMNDISLVVGGVEYPAHRLILCASSDVFQVMLMDPRWSESHESRVKLQETPACAAIFESFLRYIYTGQIRINHTTIMPLLALADKYIVKDLIKLCIDYMCSHIAHAAKHNQVVSWFQYTLSLGHYQVAQACQNFVKWNLEMVATTSDFGNLHYAIFARLLQQNDLVVHDEMVLYTCVVRWLDMQSEMMVNNGEGCGGGGGGMEALVQQIICHVRFPMMSPRQLAELLLSPLTQRYKEYLIERMAIGMAFHSGQQERVWEVAQAEGGQLFTPRLYTADKWSSLLTVENFSSLPSYHTCTLVFSSVAGLADCHSDSSCEWVVDLYPKGVWFRKFFLIVWQGTVEVPEVVLRTVRLSITCKDAPTPTRGLKGADFKVKVGILMTGVQDGVEHVMTVISRNHHFSDEERVLNLDDILSFDELNDTLPRPNNQLRTESPFLTGQDLLKIHIVITPLSEVSGIEPSEGLPSVAQQR